MELFKKKRANIFKDAPPNWSEIEKELSQPHATRYLLREEYRKKYPDGLSKSSFYEKLRFHQKKNDVDYLAPHKVGEKLYNDYSGDSIKIYDRLSNKSIKIRFFICT